MELIEIKKQTATKFVFSELVVFCSQVLIFFVVAIFTSDFLKSEERLVKYTEAKINDGSMAELGLTFIAILFVIGIFSAIGKIFDNKITDDFVHEILCEIPKTIYFFGSSVTGVMLAVSLFLSENPDSKSTPMSVLALSVSVALAAFIYGCGTSYAFKRKTHIISSPSKEQKA